MNPRRIDIARAAWAVGVLALVSAVMTVNRWMEDPHGEGLWSTTQLLGIGGMVVGLPMLIVGLCGFFRTSVASRE